MNTTPEAMCRSAVESINRRLTAAKRNTLDITQERGRVQVKCGGVCLFDCDDWGWARAYLFGMNTGAMLVASAL